jgi:glutamate dehydrogenase
MEVEVGMSEQRDEALRAESEQFANCYDWLEENMPASFFKEVSSEEVTLVVHSLMDLHLQDYVSHIRHKHEAMVLCLDSPGADLKILKLYRKWGIKNYITFVSAGPPPIPGVTENLRIALIYFTEAVETHVMPIPTMRIAELHQRVHERNPEVTDEEFNKLIQGMNTRMLTSMSLDRLALALDMFFRAKTRDQVQYEVIKNEEGDGPSLQIVLAWRNTPKYAGLYRIAKMVHRHGLVMRRVNATYIDPYSRHSILIMSIALDGAGGEPAWEVADIDDFLRELGTFKYFAGFPTIVKTFVDTGLLSGSLGNLLKSMTYFIHQVLLVDDPWFYTLDSVTEALCRHPELTQQLAQAFEEKCHPERHSDVWEKTCDELQELVEKLDTGHEMNDKRRRNVLLQGINFVRHVLRTNFYRRNKSALSFRLDPDYLGHEEQFPERPYAIFFIKGMHFIGFHIRFRDLSRGGLRTVFPERHEDMLVELNQVFSECYNLAYTQQKKNKDIPEGGAKGVIFLKPYERLQEEAGIFKRELRGAGIEAEEVEHRLGEFMSVQMEEYLLQTQRSYIDSLLTIINCEEDGTLKAKDVVDYLQRPEYIYLGPDERMGTEMIDWIAHHAVHVGYKPGLAFISSKPLIGINHKEFGVTSRGVNVYMDKMLRYLGINPDEEEFTVKISGGPDGDVAGNQILNLQRFYDGRAKLLALTDVSGTIYDPEGLDLDEMVKLFHAAQPISYYPPEKLHEGGYLLDRRTKRDESQFVQTTLCWRKQDGKVVEDWLSGSEMNRLFGTNVHQAKTDIFIPAGGRPRTLHEGNYTEFLDAEGKPTSRAIVEGANLYLTPEARRELQQRGVLIIKDSSANKGGVICSSFEVLSGLVLGEEEMLEHKERVVEQILQALQDRAADEADLLLECHTNLGAMLTEISDWVSEKINLYTDQLLAYLEPLELSDDPNDPMIRTFLAYCLPFLRENYQDRLISDVPAPHKKAIIACHIASQLVYHRGLHWHPTIVDVLPLVWEDPNISG